MTLDEFQTALHTSYEGNTSTPTSSDAEYTVRTELLKASINAWDNEPGILWNELWTNLADAADGDKTINASDLDYDMPTDFRFLGSWVRTYTTDGNETYWQVFTAERAAMDENRDPKACFVTGNKKAGFDLHFLAQPTASDTLEYPYYKEPFEPSSGSDVIEMSDPYFCVYHSLAKLHEQDGDGDRANLAIATANQHMQNMRIRNDMAPNLNPNPVDNPTNLKSGFGFGK